MKKTFLIFAWLFLSAATMRAQVAKVYDEQINPMEQIDAALKKAGETKRFVVAQVGGNWCPWCLKFADFIKKDAEISQTIDENFVYIHVNYPRQGAAKDLMDRLHNAGRFGYPVFVVMDEKGQVLHIQDSSFLEEGQGYDKEKVMRFFKGWTPEAVKK